MLCRLSKGCGVVISYGNITGNIWLPVYLELASPTRPFFSVGELGLLSLITLAFLSKPFVIVEKA